MKPRTAMMSETPEAGAGRPQSLGMPAKDFTSHQLREARAQAVSLATKNERLVAALGTARERITELGQQLDAAHTELTEVVAYRQDLERRLTEAERTRHAAFVGTLGASPVWRDYLGEEGAAS